MTGLGGVSSFCAAALGLGLAARGRGLCLTPTCDPKTEQCEVVDDCNITGKALFWASSTVSFDVQKDSSYKVSADSKTFELSADGSKQLLISSETLETVVS